MIAKIAVSAAIYAIDKPYSYRASMPVRVGARVMVPFGRANRRSEGVVLALEEGEETSLKPLLEVLDADPLLDARALRMAAFLRERYFCTFYEAIKAILPAGVWFRAQETYTILSDGMPDVRSAGARAVLLAISELGGSAEYAALRKQFQEEALRKALRYLQNKRLISCTARSHRRVADKTERIVTLEVCAQEALQYAQTKRKSAPLQTAALELLATVGQCAAKELCYFTGATMATLNRLEKLGFLSYSEEEIFRLPTLADVPPAQPIRLTPEQGAAFEGLCAQARRSKAGVALLYGVTGSGKTSVYLRLIDDCLWRGRSAALLVPEIALTPQLLSLVASHFGDEVAVLHSALRITERYDTWKRIRSGQARVVLGTRSAIFAPLQNLGLNLIDEEQEHTYKSENAPRYHAAEVAIYRGAQENALVVLGSATPSIETMHRAKTGVYSLYCLKTRYNGAALPATRIVDMKRELKEGNATIISAPLQEALLETHRRGEQAILLLNRRGASRMLVCVECGNVPTCPACSVSLTYHQANERLMCHYCGHSEPLPPRCPVCGGHLKQIGCGTQRAEEQLKALLPDSALLRMDADTVSAVNTHEKLFSRFRKENIPILLGTQMVAKGLDFPNVTFVGVLDADASLYFGSYRAAETTFNMITQVIGRAGRGAHAGTALIQTVTPKNQVIELAAAQDYDAFYEAELPLRKLRRCPPFAALLTVTFHGRQEAQVWQTARRFREVLQAYLRLPDYAQEEAVLLGPAPARVARIKFHYRCTLTISCRNTRRLRELLAYHIRSFAKDPQNRGVWLHADVNADD